MSVLVFAETHDNTFKKPALEAVFYGKKTASMLGTQCIALVLGDAANAAQLGKYGADKVLHLTNAALNSFDSQVYASVITQVAQTTGSNVVVLVHSAEGKAITGRVAVKLNAASVSGANSLPELSNGFTVAKSVYSGKAKVHYTLNSDNKVISIMGNSLPIEANGNDAPVESVSVNIPTARVKTTKVDRITGEVPLPEAEVVVSGGRGLKGPENWGILDELGKALGATMACSRPVADAHWRPHHEHVGQTGIAIRPNLYIAVGISGAIQHLAGVNNSKVIVVINKDPEAPFFKAADYGVCADLFDVVPKLTEAIKKFKAQH